MFDLSYIQGDFIYDLTGATINEYSNRYEIENLSPELLSQIQILVNVRPTIYIMLSDGDFTPNGYKKTFITNHYNLTPDNKLELYKNYIKNSDLSPTSFKYLLILTNINSFLDGANITYQNINNLFTDSNISRYNENYYYYILTSASKYYVLHQKPNFSKSSNIITISKKNYITILSFTINSSTPFNYDFSMNNLNLSNIVVIQASYPGSTATYNLTMKHRYRINGTYYDIRDYYFVIPPNTNNNTYTVFLLPGGNITLNNNDDFNWNLYFTTNRGNNVTLNVYLVYLPFYTGNTINIDLLGILT